MDKIPKYRIEILRRVSFWIKVRLESRERTRGNDWRSSQLDTHQMVLRDVRQEEALHHFLKQPIIRVTTIVLELNLAPPPLWHHSTLLRCSAMWLFPPPTSRARGNVLRREKRLLNEVFQKNKNKNQTPSSSQSCDALTWPRRRPGLPPGGRPAEQQTPAGQQWETVRPPPSADEKTVWPSVMSQRGINVSPR